MSYILCINDLKIKVMNNKMIEIDYEELVEINGGIYMPPIPIYLLPLYVLSKILE